MYKPHAKQKLVHKAFLMDGFKRGVFLAGRQSGKTYFSVNHAWLSGVIKQGRYFIVFSTYKQAHEVVWRQYLPLIPKELIYKTNESDLLIELHYVDGPVTLTDGTTIQVNHDRNKPRSTIQLLGSDQADSHRGFKADGIIFDEYGDQNGDNFSLVYEPMFSTTNGWAIFMGTPRGFNHFYDLIQYAKDEERWFYAEATWRDSPYVSEEHMKSVRDDAEKRGNLSGFMQEYELEFRAVQGAVYPDFNRNVHMVKPSDIPEDLSLYATIDFGFHTTACLFVGIDKDQNWWVIDEVYGKQETLDNIIPRIKDKLGEKRLVLMVGDSANRDAIEVMQRHFPIVGINKANDTKGYSTGIQLITQKLKPRLQLVGLPKPTLFVSKACKYFPFEMEGYKFPEEKKDRNPTDVPVKENDHGCFTGDTIVNGRRIEEFGQYMGKKEVWEWDLAGTKIKSTPDHPILTQRGLVRIDTLRYNDIICKNKLFMTVSNGTGIKVAVNGLIGHTISAQKRQLQALVRDYTDIFGQKKTVKSLLASIYITLMATLRITTYPIYNALVLLNTLQYTLKTKVEKKTPEEILSMQSTVLQNGQKLQKARKGVVKLENKTLSTYQDTKSKDTATIVGLPILQKQSLEDSATQTVKPLRYVGVVKTYNQRTKTGMYVANGITVSNCDALRYLALHLKFGINSEKDKLPTPYMQLNGFGLL